MDWRISQYPVGPPAPKSNLEKRVSSFGVDMFSPAFEGYILGHHNVNYLLSIYNNFNPDNRPTLERQSHLQARVA